MESVILPKDVHIIVNNKLAALNTLQSVHFLTSERYLLPRDIKIVLFVCVTMMATNRLDRFKKYFAHRFLSALSC